MGHGRFVVFEGIEGSGKSFQANEFYRALLEKGEDSVLTTQPWTDDKIGELIREELKDKSAPISVRTLQLLFVANRSNHVEKLIEPSMEKGRTVISDRYWMSTVAYGGAFANDQKSDLNYYLKVNEIFPRPDVVFYIDVDPEIAYKRMAERKSTTERFDKIESLKLLHQKYSELEKLYEGLWVNIDGNQEKEKVSKDIMEKYELARENLQS